MSRRDKGRSTPEAERRAGDQDGSIPTHDAIDPDTEAQLLEVAGFTRTDLYERRGPLTRRGLAHFLEPGDRIVGVARDHARVLRQDGSPQTFWNLRRFPAWVRRLDGGAGDGTGEGGLAPDGRG